MEWDFQIIFFSFLFFLVYFTIVSLILFFKQKILSQELKRFSFHIVCT